MRDYGPWETNSFRTEGGGEWVSLVMGIKEGTDCMEHWYYTQTVNHGTLHQKLMMY